jgi:hypothetical protein
MKEFGYDPYNSADAWQIGFRVRELLLPPGLRGLNLVLLS